MMLKNLKASLRTNVLTGVFVLAPFGAVLWIVLWLWDLLFQFSGLFPDSLHPRVFLEIQDPLALKAVDFFGTLLALALILIFVWLVGLVSRNYLGKRILKQLSKFLSRVPVLSTVYTTLEQLLQTFSSGQTKNFRKVVQIEYPRKGLYTLAFVTGERDFDPFTSRKGRFFNIYVPTTPNPTSGFYLLIDASEAHEVPLTVEQALKEIISMGMVRKEE